MKVRVPEIGVLNNSECEASVFCICTFSVTMESMEISETKRCIFCRTSGVSSMEAWTPLMVIGARWYLWFWERELGDGPSIAAKLRVSLKHSGRVLRRCGRGEEW